MLAQCLFLCRWHVFFSLRGYKIFFLSWDFWNIYFSLIQDIYFLTNLVQPSVHLSMWRFNCSTQKIIFHFFSLDDFISCIGFVFSFSNCVWMDVNPLDLSFTCLNLLLLFSTSVCWSYILDFIFVISQSYLCPYPGHPLTYFHFIIIFL